MVIPLRLQHKNSQITRPFQSFGITNCIKWRDKTPDITPQLRLFLQINTIFRQPKRYLVTSWSV